MYNLIFEDPWSWTVLKNECKSWSVSLEPEFLTISRPEVIYLLTHYFYVLSHLFYFLQIYFYDFGLVSKYLVPYSTKTKQIFSQNDCVKCVHCFYMILFVFIWLFFDKNWKDSFRGSIFVTIDHLSFIMSISPWDKSIYFFSIYAL